MTPEQIENLCKQAGFTPHTWPHGFSGQIANLIKLVHNAALEEAAQECEKRESALAELMPRGVCADYFNSGAVSASKRNAAAIRSLKEPTP